MLKNTFCHIPLISLKTESQLWEMGTSSWEHIEPEVLSSLTMKKRENVVRYVDESTNHLKMSNSLFFTNLLPANQHWRLFPEFRHSTAYLDIETTGLFPYEDSITTVALYDGKELCTYVKGQNLNQLREDIKQYKLIVTYNGKCFDVPFLERFLKTSIEAAHIDLRYVLKSLGYSGGLKKCERRMGVRRDGVEDIDGYFAVLLWKEYRKDHSARALESLLAYNSIDAMNLEALMVKAYNMKIKETPFLKTHKITVPLLPSVPFKVDHKIIKRLRETYFYSYLW